MTNKYSEELFGAIDTIIDKRLQALNKDITILCNIDDDTDAAKGKYIVSNNGLKFTAFTEKTDYVVGESVWVLIPNGDYENTKMIIGKNIRYDADSFIWVNPLLGFVDMTGDICENSAKDLFGLTANEPETNENPSAQKKYLNDGFSIIKSDLDRGGFEGLDKIAITASFKTFSSIGDYPTKGSFGLHFVITTDKEMLSNDTGKIGENEISFDFDSSEMIGNPYNYETFLDQSYVFTFNPEEQGNIKDISCYFYQNCDFYAGATKFPYTLNDKVIPHNIFVNNLTIKLGYSSSKISGTTAMLWSTPTTFIVSTNKSDFTRTLHPRLVYRRENGTYKYINNFNNFKELNREINGLNVTDPLEEYPKIKFYKQDLSVGYSDKRAGDFYHEIDWNNDEPYYDIDNFQKTVQLDNKSKELFKVAFIFKKDNAYTVSSRLEALASTIGENFKYTNDDKAAIQLFVDATYTSDDIFGVKNENDEYTGGYLQELIGTEFWDEEWDYNSNLPTRVEILWNYVTLISKKYFNNNLKIDGNSVNIAEYLAQKDIYKKYTSYETDPWKNFEQNKFRLETFYVSPALVFTNSVTQESQIADLIQGLKLTATDDKKGIYTIYKATENANSELIKPSDALIKRTIEASFTSFITGSDDFDAAERIYWLIPKANTMIKEPAEGVGFGDGHYVLVPYTESEFQQWKNNSEDKRVLYVLSGGKYNLVKKEEAEYSATTKYYIKTQERLLLRDQEARPENTSDESVVEYDDINEITNDEKQFLNDRPNFWVIVEDRTDEQNRLKTASLVYQIKQFYRRSLTNNTIIAVIYKNGQIYTASIELFFGVKGTNGADYALSIIPTFEKYIDDNGDEAINNSPNAWTFNSTTEYKLTAMVYNSNDELKTNNFDFEYRWLFQGQKLSLDSDGASASIKSDNDWGSINENQYIGGIIKCVATPKQGETGINSITQYYILPVRTNRNIMYVDGPDTIAYDANGVKPEYYNMAYSLKDIENQNITISSNEITRKIFDQTNEKFFPTIENGNLIPTSSFTIGVDYKFYIKIPTQNDEVWYQPILIILNSYGNTAINNLSGDKPIKTSTNKNKTIASIMSITTANDSGQLSGIVIGDLPAEGTGENATERSGILGYLNDNETYGLFSDGTGFLGKGKEIKITDNGNLEISLNATSGILPVGRGGTGATTLSPNSLLIGHGTNAISALSAGTSGQFLASSGENSAPTWKSADATPINNSTNLITSGGVYTALSSKANNSHNHAVSDITNFENAVKTIVENNYSALNGTNAVLTQITINDITYNVGVLNSFGTNYLTLTVAN